jgi:hypothetical protein
LRTQSAPICPRLFWLIATSARTMSGQARLTQCVDLFVRRGRLHATFALDSDQTIARVVHTTLGAKEDGPKEISPFIQTKHGYLWLGSVDGLFRFDRISFEHYEPQSSPAFVARSVRSLSTLPKWGSLDRSNQSFGKRPNGLLENGQTENYTRHDGVQMKRAVFGAGSRGRVCPKQ